MEPLRSSTLKFRLGQVRLGQVRLGLVWFGSVRLGSVRLLGCQVRLGQVRLGWVVLCQVRLSQEVRSTSLVHNCQTRVEFAGISYHTSLFHKNIIYCHKKFYITNTWIQYGKYIFGGKFTHSFRKLDYFRVLKIGTLLQWSSLPKRMSKFIAKVFMILTPPTPLNMHDMGKTILEKNH